MGCTSRFDRIRRGLCVTFLPLALAIGIGPASAEKVGVAAAVNPDAFSSRGGQLNIGNSIFFNERISTTGSGLVQVLLVDGSTFTVGPGSDLVIDKFVYNPKKETGQVVATFSKGAMRYVGGKISKNADGVTIKTPTGSLAVRGGMVQGIVSGKTILFSFLFGKEMVFTAANGKTYTATGSATYTGTALGTVATNLNPQQEWRTHDAMGKLWMRWNFENRAGTFKVTDFDKKVYLDGGGSTGTFHRGLDFGGRMTMPNQSGPNQFSGALYGKYGYSWYGGYAAGSFVKGPGQIAGQKPDGVIGNWAIRNGNYNAGGIFAGSRTVPGAVGY